jgi:hypothetical protein
MYYHVRNLINSVAYPHPEQLARDTVAWTWLRRKAEITTFFFSYYASNYSRGVDPVTRDLARAMVTTIELYLVYGAYLSPLWWMDVCVIKQQSYEVPGSYSDQRLILSHLNPTKVGF